VGMQPLSNGHFDQLSNLSVVQTCSSVQQRIGLFVHFHECHTARPGHFKAHISPL
jgi:hypothetical protein